MDVVLLMNLVDKTIYGKEIKILKDGVKVNKDYQISIIKDQAFKYLAKVYSKVIIKFLKEAYILDENLIEDAYFVDTSLPDLRYDDKKMTMDLLVKIPPYNYINIEANTSISKGIRIKNTNYLLRLILSKQISGDKFKEIRVSQINFNLYSTNYMGGIINIYEAKNNLNGELLPDIPSVINIGLDKVYENPYNENISDWSMRFLKMLTSRSIKYTYELAGDYDDLKEVARLMKEYSEDTKNLMYYDKEEMDERVRLSDLEFAKEDGIDEGKEQGIKQGYNLGIEIGKKENTINIAKKMLDKGTPVNDISEITGLTKEEILKLK